MANTQRTRRIRLGSDVVWRDVDNRPLAVELFAGLHGWGEGALAAGFRVVGFDIVDMCALLGRLRPAGIDLVLQDVKTMHGSQLKDAEIIFASPPCQEFSKYAMPFGALWEEHDCMDDDGGPPGNYLHKPCPNTYLFHWCFVLQREASEAAGRHIPMVIENVRGAGRFVGKSAWNYGSFHLWGDVPALMPINLKRGRKAPGNGTWFKQGEGYGLSGANGRKNNGGSWFHIGSPGQTETNRNPVHEQRFSHGSNTRKMASAMIAKIPFELSSHIAKTYWPR